MKKIYFAGGCFWGVERYFQLINDSIKTTVGYGQTTKENPTYEEICANLVEGIETVELEYDENVITLNELLVALFKIINPEQENGQGNDHGFQYQVAIFYQDPSDYKQINDFLINERKKYKEFYVKLEKLESYYLAEELHQNYLTKNPTGYCHINLSEVLTK